MADARVLCGGSDRKYIIVNFYTIVGVYSIFGNCAAFIRKDPDIHLPFSVSTRY